MKVNRQVEACLLPNVDDSMQNNPKLLVRFKLSHLIIDTGYQASMLRTVHRYLRSSCLTIDRCYAVFPECISIFWPIKSQNHLTMHQSIYSTQMKGVKALNSWLTNWLIDIEDGSVGSRISAVQEC